MSEWHFLSNTFLVITDGSTKLMLILSPDHRARLQSNSSDPEILAILNTYSPLDDQLSLSYSQWFVATGLYRGATLAFENKMEELAGVKLNQWIPQVQVVFPESTPEYKSLFPMGRAAFNKGAYDMRINNLHGLAGLLANYPALAAVKTDVNNFYTALLAIRATQQGKEEDVRVRAEQLDGERINVAVAMYANLGKLMAKFAATPEKVTKFFDLALIQSPPKNTNTFSVVVAAKDTANIVPGGFTDTTQFTLYTGNTRGLFFTSNSATGVVSEGVTLEPNTSKTVLATDLGAPGNTFLNVTNLDELNQGSYSVVML